jgi:hypothetical protein
MGEVRMESALGLNEYISHFANKERTSSPGTIYVDAQYFQDRDSDIYKQASALEYRPNVPDCTLEFVIAAQYTGTVKVRPVEAAKILPEGKASDIRIAAATYAKLQEIKFLDPQNRDRIGRYELMIRTLKQRNGVTQAEIDACIRSLVSDIVDEEFGKISFRLENSNTYSIARSHMAILTRNPQNGQFVLSYGGTYTNEEIRTITANSLEALLSEMRNGKYKTDFDQTGIDQVRAQAALIPAVALSDAALNEVKNILTAFYTNPSTKTYNAMMEIYRLYIVNEVASRQSDRRYTLMCNAYGGTIQAFNPELARKVSSDAGKQTAITTLTTAQQQRLVQLR